MTNPVKCSSATPKTNSSASLSSSTLSFAAPIKNSSSEIPVSNEAFIELQYPRPSKVFTSGDIISGKLIIKVASELSTSSIVVKLEGESKTSVTGITEAKKKKPVSITQPELHKVLYKSVQVFPPHELSSALTPDEKEKKQYTLAPGIHEYSFNFTIPLKNHCVVDLKGFTSKYSFSLQGVNAVNQNQEFIKHVSLPLPPTLEKLEAATFDTDAGKTSVNYFVKATIHRGSFKTNLRVVEPFQFAPSDFEKPATNELLKTAFTRKEFELTISKSPKIRFPFFIEARYSNPGYIDLNNKVSPIPGLRFFIMTTTNLPQLCSSGGSLSQYKLAIDLLSIYLIGHTTVLGGEFRKTFETKYVILNQNLSKVNSPLKIIPLSGFADSGNKTANGDALFEHEISGDIFAGSKNFNVGKVIPSYKTCNSKRDYLLMINVGVKIVDPYAGTEVSQLGDTSSLLDSETKVELEINKWNVFSGFDATESLASEPDEHICNGQPVPVQTLDEKNSNSSSKKPPLPNRPPGHPLNSYGLLAGDITNSLTSKFTKLSMKINEKDPALGSTANKVADFLNKKNSLLQKKLGNNTITSYNSATATTTGTVDSNASTAHYDNTAPPAYTPSVNSSSTPLATPSNSSNIAAPTPTITDALPGYSVTSSTDVDAYGYPIDKKDSTKFQDQPTTTNSVIVTSPPVTTTTTHNVPPIPAPVGRPSLPSLTASQGPLETTANAASNTGTKTTSQHRRPPFPPPGYSPN